MRLHRALGVLLLSTLASTPVLAGDDHYQELFNTYHELVALRESLDQTALVQGAQGPQGPQGVQGATGDTGDQGPEGDAGGSSLSSADSSYVTNRLDQLFLEVSKSEQWYDDIEPYATDVVNRIERALANAQALNAELDALEAGDVQ
ncbi:collagen-like protein [Alcanivorax sp. S6407]|uniref:collagen-like protein n=1 Tax=Alcanivorax sp. S6407 TaxID=2926424 RepID=UPI001FF4A06A|nr:collagen-like protein [Alcanivorax sp. S6407]MCK0154039.1 collagen-like protein [Alcanivorax sp. S6407]